MMTPKDQKQQRLDDNEGLLFRPDNEGQQTTNIILSVNSLAGRTNRATLAVALSGGRELLIIVNIKFSQHLPQGRAGERKRGGRDSWGEGGG